MTFVYVLTAIAVSTLVAVFVSYNRFVTQRQLLENSWSNVETELQRRYDLIPVLVNTVKGYAAHEDRVLFEVTAARAAAASPSNGPATQAATENVFVSALQGVFAVAEGYPDLKASEQFLKLQHELANTEDRIQAARRFYNGNVRDYNTRVQSMPSALVASAFNFDLREYFEINQAINAETPTVGFGGN